MQGIGLCRGKAQIGIKMRFESETVLVIIIDVKIELSEHGLVAFTALEPVTRHIVLSEFQLHMSIGRPVVRLHDGRLHAAGHILRDIHSGVCHFKSRFLVCSDTCEAHLLQQFLLGHNNLLGMCAVHIQQQTVNDSRTLLIHREQLTIRFIFSLATRAGLVYHGIVKDRNREHSGIHMIGLILLIIGINLIRLLDNGINTLVEKPVDLAVLRCRREDNTK